MTNQPVRPFSHAFDPRGSSSHLTRKAAPTGGGFSRSANGEMLMTQKPLRISGPKAHGPDLIHARLAQAAGRARTHVVTTIDQLDALVLHAENQLAELRIPKKHWPGTTAVLISANPSLRSKSIVSRIIIRRNSSCWILEAVDNTRAREKSAVSCSFDVSEEAWEASLANLMKLYRPVRVNGHPVTAFDPFEAIRFLRQIPGLTEGSAHARIKAVSELERLASAIK